MKIDRLLSIINVLSQKERVTAKELADKFEVSKRTILRDLDTLMMAGIPVVSFSGIGGGVSVLPEYKLNKTLLSKNDITHLSISLKGLSSIEQSDSLRYLIHKLLPDSKSPVLVESDIIIDFSSWFDGGQLQQKINMLRQAIAATQCVTLCYLSRQSSTERVVEPYKLIFKQNNWYLYAFCLKAQDFRLFKLVRILSTTVLPERFMLREHHHLDLKTMFSSSGRFSFKPDYPIEVLLECDGTDSHFIADLMGTSCLKPGQNNMFNIQFDTSDIDWVVSIVLGLQGKVRVIQPNLLRVRVQQKLQEMVSFYKDDT